MSDFRVAIGGFAHETNTFSPTLTDRTDFEERGVYVGSDLVETFAGTNTAQGGMIDAGERLPVELYPTMYTSAPPGGYVTVETYNHFSELLLDRLESFGEVDGVALPMHGAMVPQGLDDGEGPLLSKVRSVVGQSVPIAMSLDLHANVSDEMVEVADIIVAFETYPHVDMGHTGEQALGLLVEAMADRIDPVLHVERPPVIASSPEQYTGDGPMAAVRSRQHELESEPAVLKVNSLPGFSAADIPWMGWTIITLADGSESAAESASADLATYVWEQRESFVGEYPSPSEAVHQATQAIGNGPVILAELGDNPGAGGTADETPLLRELLSAPATNAGFAIMADSTAIDRCIERGVGERLTLSLGGGSDGSVTDPIEDVEAYVKTITDGVYVNTGPMATGTRNDLGRCVRLQCGPDRALEVLLTDHRVQPLDAEIWRHAGIHPEQLDIIGLKSTNHYRADYGTFAGAVIPVDSEGLAFAGPTKLDYSAVPRPQYPLDVMSDDAYQPGTDRRLN